MSHEAAPCSTHHRKRNLSAAFNGERVLPREASVADRSGSHDIIAGREPHLSHSAVWTARGGRLRPLWQTLLCGPHPSSRAGTTPRTRQQAGHGWRTHAHANAHRGLLVLPTMHHQAGRQHPTSSATGPVIAPTPAVRKRAPRSQEPGAQGACGRGSGPGPRGVRHRATAVSPAVVGPPSP